MQTERISLLPNDKPDSRRDARSLGPSVAFLVPLSTGTATATGISTGGPVTGVVEVRDHFIIGRDPCNHLIIADAFVSSRHARIERRGETFVIRDLQSRNGTYLNGSRVTEAVLALGDRLRFGETSFSFSDTIPEKSALKSKNRTWQLQLQRLPSFAATDFPVLITGPSGAGKEVITRAIHKHSLRNRGPFISINCSALSESLIESELFGHTKGAFTGAIGDRKGAFESARGGTIFLDEIGDLPLALQPKLLRAIENREIRPVGADRTIDIDVRIVAATHKNLNRQIATGAFREDLFYRLNVCQVKIPSLNERIEDFEDLLYSFAKEMHVRFSFNAVEYLKSQPWHGNVRELKNLVARASAYLPGKHIQPEDVAPLIEFTARREVQLKRRTKKGPVIKEIEREIILKQLIANGGNQRQTAKDLGLAKSTLHDRIRTYEIDLETILEEDLEESTQPFVYDLLHRDAPNGRDDGEGRDCARENLSEETVV